MNGMNGINGTHNIHNSQELIKYLRGIELAGFCFSGIDFGEKSSYIQRNTMNENKREQLIDTFTEFMDLQFEGKIYDNLMKSIDLKIEEQLGDPKEDSEIQKTFTIPNDGVCYVDVDLKYLHAPATLLLEFNWLALMIKPMIDFLHVEQLNFNNSLEFGISSKNMEFFNLMIHCLYNYILTQYRKKIQEKYSFDGEQLDEMVANLKLGIFIEDPNFWSIKADSGMVFYSVYQELCIVFDAVIIKEISPNKINPFFERIAKVLNFKIENYSFINFLADDQLLSSNKDDTIILKLWLAIREEFQLDDLNASKFYLDLLSVKDIVYTFIRDRIMKDSSIKQKQKISENLFFELMDAEYELIAKEYKNLVTKLNTCPEDWAELKFKYQNMKLASGFLSIDKTLAEECKKLENELEAYNFIKYECNLFSLGKYLEETFKIADEYKKLFKDPEAKDKDSKSIENAVKNFDRLYRERIIGQDHIIEPLWSSLKKWYVGIRTNKPVGSFLLCGPTGVGKTETAKFLSEELGSFDNLITLDMSEYQSEIDKTKIIGVAPGYAGYEQGAGVLDKVAENPRSVILFDEIEKAHPLIFDLLLQLLDEGRLTDHKGNEVSFKECLIICTTNAHYGDIEHLGSSNRSDIINILSLSFRKEFLARFTDIVKFNNLSSEVMELIFNKKLAEEIKEINESSQVNISIIEDENYYQKKVKLVGNMDHSLGARELGRLINEEIIAPLIQLIIDLGSEIEGKQFYFDSIGKLKVKG